MGKIIKFATTLYVDHIVFTAWGCTMTIPEQMFLCNSLITLELKGCDFSPIDLRFPTVRTLHLEHCGIHFRDEECSSGRVDFSQGCPKLIALSLVECIFIGKPEGSDNVGKIIGFATTVDHIVLTAYRCTIPKQMFSCKSLITLELKCCLLSPNDLRFPTVRTLLLDNCSFDFHDENCSSGCLDFSQGCPKLIALSLVE
ncbi:hypothetical protein Tsubulata_016159 [Turnera subulata]|uniref:Uncharacterized protein n=1 Tax=Turnera subulata TaxID=218843 RepID=A0A9Q0JR93_9ROSI|nr:hypothetical protein Tsubulata_016159 [Turnera subulata]